MLSLDLTLATAQDRAGWRKVSVACLQSINLFVMKQSTCDIAVTALTGTTRLKSGNKHEFEQNMQIKLPIINT